jgi:hypothetical protein
MSGPIAVADATPWSFQFVNFRTAVNVMVRFYTDAAGTVDVGTLGTGSRDVTATNVSAAYQGNATRPTETMRDIACNIYNGTVTAMPDGQWREFSLGGGLGQITIAAAANVNPGGALAYRIFVEAVGTSSEA